jgi:hypothetical protein
MTDIEFSVPFDDITTPIVAPMVITSSNPSIHDDFEISLLFLKSLRNYRLRFRSHVLSRHALCFRFSKYMS